MNTLTKKQDNASKIMSLLEKMKPQMALALPKHLNVDRISRVALTEFRKNPKLQQCDATSFVAAVMLSAQLGVEVGALGHAYLIPYGNECTFMLGYRGMLDLARRSGVVVSLTAHVVYEKDKFEYSFGLHPKLVHEPSLNEQGKVIAAYAVANLKDGAYQFEVMSKADIDRVRESSKARDSIPWTKHYDEMAKKTVIRRLFKYLPVSIDMQKAIAYEDKAEARDISIVSAFKDAVGETIDLPAEFDQEMTPPTASENLQNLIANKSTTNVVEEFFEEK